MLQVCHLTLYAPRRRITPVWRVGLEVRRGDRTAVVGESGGGKTSLAWASVGYPVPGQTVVEGSVRFEGVDLLALSRERRADLYYRRLALVPQNVQDTFHPTQPLWKSVGEVLRKEGGRRLGRQEILEHVEPLGAPMGLLASHWDARPHELSGGQKQRMGLVQAMVNDPHLLILDEPTHALDELNRARFIRFLDRWTSERGVGVLLCTHDLGLAAAWADRILVLYRGCKVEELPAGPMVRPLHPYTRALLDSAVRLGDAPGSRSAVRGHALPLEGEPVGCGYADRCAEAVDLCGREAPPLVEAGRQRVWCHCAVGRVKPFNNQEQIESKGEERCR
ncbi:MAG: ABC transporter ATP-binding protein [Syntrophobacteraceae bacterium]|jgi:oligopeptide/dipeptide ABC transporter ATP-binding protein|nr:ABC transporter ATP-binding protein [Syntrophobacteraceae bacterium]